MSFQEYKELCQMKGAPPEVWVFLGCTMFFLGMYKEAEEACTKGLCLSGFVKFCRVNIAMKAEFSCFDRNPDHVQTFTRKITRHFDFDYCIF
jgi:hypothetical protein